LGLSSCPKVNNAEYSASLAHYSDNCSKIQ
jgi:hypothetical protein